MCLSWESIRSMPGRALGPQDCGLALLGLAHCSFTILRMIWSSLGLWVTGGLGKPSPGHWLLLKLSLAIRISPFRG